MSDPPWACLLFYQIKKSVRENRTMRNYKIAVAGTGYVGLSLGVLLSQHHQVVAVDIVQAKVDMINNKKSPMRSSSVMRKASRLMQSALRCRLSR